MIVQCLPPMGFRHPTDAVMYQIQYRPQCFQDLPINLSCSRNEAGGISGETWVNVPMYMKEANCSSDLLIGRKMQIRIGIKSPPEIFPILTHQIIIEDQPPDSIHVVFHCGIDTIIHIHLSYGAKSMLARLHMEGCPLFSQLEIYDAIRTKAPVADTSTRADSGISRMVLQVVGILDSIKFMTCWSLSKHLMSLIDKP